MVNVTEASIESPTGTTYTRKRECCTANATAPCNTDCGGGGGNCTVPGVTYPSVSIASTTSFKCCDNGESTVACNGDETGTALCGMYERASQTNETEKDYIQIGWKNGQPVNQTIIVTHSKGAGSLVSQQTGIYHHA